MSQQLWSSLKYRQNGLFLQLLDGPNQADLGHTSYLPAHFPGRHWACSSVCFGLHTTKEGRGGWGAAYPSQCMFLLLSFSWQCQECSKSTLKTFCFWPIWLYLSFYWPQMRFSEEKREEKPGNWRDTFLWGATAHCWFIFLGMQYRHSHVAAVLWQVFL